MKLVKKLIFFILSAGVAFAALSVGCTKEHIHEFTPWTSDGDKYHVKFCTLCHEEVSAPHVFQKDECVVCHMVKDSESLVYDGVYEGQTLIGYAVSGRGEDQSPNISVPERYKGYPVISLRPEAFKNDDKLISITLPSTVTEIGAHAFDFCTQLVSVNLGNGLISLGEYAFLSCTALEKIDLPDSLESIGASAFSTCANLKIVNMRDGVTSIGAHAFSSCSNLVSLTISRGVTTLESGFASFCANLKVITIPDGVIRISETAFAGNIALEAVFLPSSVKNVGVNAFYLCNVKDVYFTGSAEQWNEIYFANGNEKLTGATLHFNAAQ